MKKLNIRRMVSTALAVVLVMSLTVGAFAVEAEDIPEDGIEATPEEGTEAVPQEEGTEGAPEVIPEEGAEATPEEGTPEDGTETAPADTGLTNETAPTETTEDDMTADVLAFSDVLEDHGFYTAIMDCATKGITSGYADGTFRPTNSVTCAQFCVMLSRAFYPTDIEKYPDPTGKLAWFSPNTKALYYNKILDGTSFKDSYLNTTVMNQAISRYDMARLMTNIMAKKGFSATTAQKTEAQKKIADYKSIPTKYQDAVKNVFALGIITGYSNGMFGGNNVMNRGQGCVVIYRMTKYTPAAVNPMPDVDDSGKPTENTGNTSNTGTGTGNTGNTGTSSGSTGTTTNKTPTLSNGKPITETNVRALLKELQAKYPDGSLYAPVGTKVSTNIYQPLGYSTGSECAGWAALASDYIFGKTATVRIHKNFTQVRLGDVLYTKNHTSVIIGTERCQNCGGTAYKTCDSGSACVVNWEWTATPCPTCSIPNYPDGQNPTVITRYPADTAVPYLPYTKGSGTTGSTGNTSTVTPSTQPSIQDLLDAPCPLCGKTGGSSTFNDAMTKKVCSTCYNTNRAAARAYLDS